MQDHAPTKSAVSFHNHKRPVALVAATGFTY
jgi:hypothetical protein